MGTDQRRKEEEKEDSVTQWVRILVVAMGSPIGCQYIYTPTDV